MSEDQPAPPPETPEQMQERARALIGESLAASGSRATELMHQAQMLLRASVEATRHSKWRDDASRAIK